MKVILIRHFKVDHPRKRRCYYQEFLDDIAAYNTKPVIEPRELDFPISTVYISTLPRTEATAKYLKGNKNIIKTALIDEVDFSGRSRIKFRMSNTFWYLIAAAKWQFNSRRVNETIKHTRNRASEFLKLIEERNEDSIVVSHGMFLLVLMNLMTNKGYSGAVKTNRLANGQVIEMEKIPSI
jgi:broad specificity phosphatase PhoE